MTQRFPEAALLAQASSLVAAEDMRLEGPGGASLFLRHKRLSDRSGLPPREAVLFVHGATYPAHSTFDLALEGWSWMDYLALAGADIYALDLRGYGHSSKPPPTSAPVASTADAVVDVGVAVEHILATRAIDRLSLIGWSWGTVVMAAFAAARPQLVRRLVLYAPLWLRSAASAAAPPQGAYRTVTADAGLSRWLQAIPEARRDAVAPPSWRQSWLAATFTGEGRTCTAPNGVLRDGAEYWGVGRPYYDPAGITAPTLLIVGDRDRDTPSAMARALFDGLVAAETRRLVVLGECTHMALLERPRRQLFDEVSLFLGGDAGA
jgi:pimeloyl-ACP methyl ester carboxylesterase